MEFLFDYPAICVLSAARPLQFINGLNSSTDLSDEISFLKSKLDLGLVVIAKPDVF